MKPYSKTLKKNPKDQEEIAVTPKLKDHATKNALCPNWKLEVGVDSTGQLVVKRGKQHETEQTNQEKAGVTLKINSKNAKGSGMLETIRNIFWEDETSNHRNQRTQSFWNKSEMRKLIWLLFEFAISKQHNFGHPLNFSKRRDWIYHVPAITKLVALELLLLTSSCLVRLQKNQIWAKCIQIELRNNRNRHLKSWSENDFGLKSHEMVHSLSSLCVRRKLKIRADWDPRLSCLCWIHLKWEERGGKEEEEKIARSAKISEGRKRRRRKEKREDVCWSVQL